MAVPYTAARDHEQSDSRATPGRPLCDRPVGERRERGHLSDEWTEDQATDRPYREREREEVMLLNGRPDEARHGHAF